MSSFGPTSSSSSTGQFLLRLLSAVVVGVLGLIATHWMKWTLLKDHTADSEEERERFASTVRGWVVQPAETPRLNHIGGLTSAKRILRRAVLLPLQHPHTFFKGPPPIRPAQGVLFHGPPGTGKTMMARAIANEAQVPIMLLTSSSLESKWFGDTPKLLASAFRVAKDEYAPCIIFIDEIDGVGGRTRNEKTRNVSTL